MAKTSICTIALTALLLAGCVKSDIPPFQTTVVPRDPVPAECAMKAPAIPRLTMRDYSDDETAREYLALKQYAKNMRKGYERCQLWAKGQR